MTSSFIPRRIRRAKQQITVKLYQDQFAMLTSMADSSMTAGITPSVKP
jgi:hypothetical protein